MTRFSIDLEEVILVGQAALQNLADNWRTMDADNVNATLSSLGLPEYYIDSLQDIKFTGLSLIVLTYEPTIEGYLRDDNGDFVIIKHVLNTFKQSKVIH